MREVKVDRNYLFSLWIKAFLVLFVFWGIVYLILILLNAISLQVEILSEENNAVTISALFFITFAIAGLGSFMYYSLIKGSNMLTLEDGGIRVKDGIIGRKEKFIPYKEIKNAHCDDDSLSIVDKMLRISLLKVHASDTIIMSGIARGTEIANQINHMADLNKEARVDPMAALAEEVKSLKNEIAELKERMQKAKEIRKPEPAERKKKFRLGPFDEIIN